MMLSCPSLTRYVGASHKHFGQYSSCAGFFLSRSGVSIKGLVISETSCSGADWTYRASMCGHGLQAKGVKGGRDEASFSVSSP
ncbi:MAG: hypothetical protein ACYTFG_00265 [Planctomycetota bacterium]|jgi:hypothetical protein